MHPTSSATINARLKHRFAYFVDQVSYLNGLVDNLHGFNHYKTDFLIELQNV